MKGAFLSECTFTAEMPS